MPLNAEIELKRWKPSKNDERERCGPNLYVKGYLNGKKKFQMRFGNNSWIDVGYYPDTSLAQAREITITAKRIHKDRLASHDQIKRAAVTAKTGAEFEARLSGTVVETKERSGIPTFDDATVSGINFNLPLIVGRTRAALANRSALMKCMLPAP
jgi:hypothetical protein